MKSVELIGLLRHDEMNGCVLRKREKGCGSPCGVFCSTLVVAFSTKPAHGNSDADLNCVDHWSRTDVFVCSCDESVLARAIEGLVKSFKTTVKRHLSAAASQSHIILPTVFDCSLRGPRLCHCRIHSVQATATSPDLVCFRYGLNENANGRWQDGESTGCAIGDAAGSAAIDTDQVGTRC